jgi:hypothetical protein
MYVTGAVIEGEGISIKRDRLRGVPGEGGDECGVRREGGDDHNIDIIYILVVMPVLLTSLLTLRSWISVGQGRAPF